MTRHDFSFDYCDLCDRAVPTANMRPGAICATCDDELSMQRAITRAENERCGFTAENMQRLVDQGERDARARLMPKSFL
jgi:hypothetical protein